jgi:small subunit ribosomal protein S8
LADTLWVLQQDANCIGVQLASLKKFLAMVNYAISDMMTRLRNAIRAKKPKVLIVSTKMTRSIAEILKNEGYIVGVDYRSFEAVSPTAGAESSSAQSEKSTSNESGKKKGKGTSPAKPAPKADQNVPSLLYEPYFEMTLKYKGKQMVPVLTNLQALSKPGVRFYRKANEIPQVLGGLGLTILSTSKGIFPDHKARELSLGGEILCMVW